MEFIYPQSPVVLGELAAIMLQHLSADLWGGTWLRKAREAEERGNQLIIIELPKDEIPTFHSGQLFDDTFMEALSA